jgi:hypothetical protein
MFGCRMLYPPRNPLPAEGSLVVMTIHGRVRDLQSESVTLWQGKGPFRWATHQILGVMPKKVRLENSFGACDTHASWYWEKICTGGVPINPGLTLNSQFSIENE